MALSIKEIKVKDVVLIADKGFFSQDNIAALDAEHLQYIIPLNRNNALIDFTPIQQANYKKVIKNYFVHEGRIIWYYQYEKDGKQLITYLDERLRVEEEQDYLLRIETQPETHTKEQFFEKSHRFGTLTLHYKVAQQLSPQEVYQTYKQRNEIEVMFDSYKNFLDGDRMYMQDRQTLEGWLASNFLAMIAYYKLYRKLKEQKLIGKEAPSDIIVYARAIYKVKINDEWYLSEITQKTQKLFAKIGIDYLNRRS
jgi:transposase